MLGLAGRATVGWVFSWGVVLATSPLAAVTGLSRRTWMFLVLSGVATGLSWLCYIRALQLGPASKVAPIDKLSLVFVLVFAASFLGELLTWKTLAGGALIAGGGVLLALK